MIDKIQKFSNPKCYTSSSASFRITTTNTTYFGGHGINCGICSNKIVQACMMLCCIINWNSATKNSSDNHSNTHLSVVYEGHWSLFQPTDYTVTDWAVSRKWISKHVHKHSSIDTYCYTTVLVIHCTQCNFDHWKLISTATRIVQSTVTAKNAITVLLKEVTSTWFTETL
jgi:hypothetical protein